MNKEDVAGAAQGSLDAWQRAEIAKTEAIKLSLMVHGGAPDYSERLADGLTKREQVRVALEHLDYVDEVVFALDPSLEADLFDFCDGTVLLIERNAEQRGARFELALHVGQQDVARKLFVFIPDDRRVPELEGEGFFATLVRDRVKPLHRVRYSDHDYEECCLIEKALEFAEGLRIERSDDILLPPS